MMKESKTVTRRDFIRGTAYQAVSAAVGLLTAEQILLGRLTTAKSWGLPRKTSRVIIVRNENVLDENSQVKPEIIKKMLNSAVMAFTGEIKPSSAWKSLFSPSDQIGIKSSSNMMPTSPPLLKAMRASLEKSGIGFNHIKVADKKAFSQFADCNALINVPGLKTHWLSGIAASLKNYINTTMVPSMYHADSCANLGKVWTKPLVKDKTRLIVVDAVKALFNGGPQVDPRYIWDYRGIIVGDDPVAVDIVCLQILQAKRNEYKNEFWLINPPPKHIEIADKTYHLGNSDMAKIDLIKLGWEENMLL